MSRVNNAYYPAHSAHYALFERKMRIFACYPVVRDHHALHYQKVPIVLMDQTLRSFFGQYGELQGEDLDKIKACASQRTVQKGSFLLKEGTISKHFNLVITGSFRLYYLKEGLDTSVWFSFQNNSSIELYSYISGSPSEYFIECIEEAEVITFSKEDIDSLCKENSTLDGLFKAFWQDVVQSLINRLTSLQKYSPEERYIKLIEDTDYLNRIPQKYLASYIGVTTTSLSRIKRKFKAKLS